MSIENYLDVAKGLLGVSLEWTNFSDLNTSAGPSLPVTIGQKSQPFSARIADLPIEPGSKLELWIKVVWQDEQKKDGVSRDLAFRSMADYLGTAARREIPAGVRSKGEVTVEREEAILQTMIWERVQQLVGQLRPA